MAVPAERDWRVRRWPTGDGGVRSRTRAAARRAPQGAEAGLPAQSRCAFRGYLPPAEAVSVKYLAGPLSCAGSCSRRCPARSARP
jgi:hypothetical protein